MSFTKDPSWTIPWLHEVSIGHSLALSAIVFSNVLRGIFFSVFYYCPGQEHHRFFLLDNGWRT